MPHRKRCHGRKKNNKEKGDTSLHKPHVPQTSRFQSQQVTPTPTSQVSTANPAKYEKGPTQSSTAVVTVKPGTTPATPAAPSGASAAGAAGGGGFTTTQKGPSLVTPQATVSKPTPAPSAKVPTVSSGTGPAGTTGVKITDPLKDKAQSTTIPSSKPGAAKVDPAVGKPSAPAGAQKQTSAQKVQVEVGPPGAKVSTEDVDPFDALSGTLPSSRPVAPKVPAFTGPEVKEPNVKAEKGLICGERDDTLPPGYRRADLEKKTPAGVPEKPKDVPKPISTDEAMDSLSAGFVSSAPAAPKKTDVKTETVGAVDVRSAGISNFAPPPPYQQKQPTTSQPAPPADKKARIETLAQPTKPKTDQTDSSMSLDALSALGDTLGAPEPPKKEAELKPGDIVHEKDLTSKKGVRVGEREDTLPPDYRFSEEELKKYPPPKKEPSLDTTEALDILSGDFIPPSAASSGKTPVCPPSKSPATPSDSASDLALDALAGDFVAPSSASKVQSAVSGPPHADRQLSDGTSSALDALSDTLADFKAAPEPAPVLPKDVVKEKNIVEERVNKPGERDDTLPPDHRFKEEDRKAFEAAKQKDVKPKPTSMDDTAALDMLSSDFSVVPPVKPSAPDAQRFTPEPQPPTFKASGPVFDELAEKVIPNLTDPKAKDSKPKGKGAKPKSKPKKQSVEDSSATEKQPGKLSSDVVPSSSTKSGNR
ncbi:calpastatin isoform X15 [Sinocyclocheilus grahami]|uniref:calpastatin isoform X15 n=1 Tax=Sinocyclocheilus grahami TaxID=75366 RepID=UPI0007AD124E|nr:PREDICTED: calpastatin isoform X15 [Sinocyclocheilus grahami]